MLKCLVFISLSCLFLGCRTYADRMEDPISLVTSGRCQEAYKRIQDVSDLQDSENAVLKKMEEGSVLFCLSRYAEASSVWNEALRKIENAPRFRLSNEAKALLVNDSHRPYESVVDDYEQLMLAVMTLVSIHSQSQYQSQLEAAARLNVEVLDRLLSDKEEQYLGQVMEDVKRLVYVLVGLSYWRLNQFDSAFISFRKLLTTPQSKTAMSWFCPYLMGMALQSNRSEEGVSLCGSSVPPLFLRRVNWIQNGVLGTKKSFEMSIALDNGHIIRLAFPVMFRQKPLPPRLGQAFLWADLNLWAHESLEKKRLKQVLRMTSRQIIKHKIQNSLVESTGLLGALIFGIWGAFSEVADTRGWSLLPRGIYLHLEAERRIRGQRPAGSFGWKTVWHHPL